MRSANRPVSLDSHGLALREKPIIHMQRFNLENGIHKEIKVENGVYLGSFKFEFILDIL